MAVFRLGRIAQFLSKAVVTGFLAGAAIDVTIGELPKLTGTDADGDNSWQELGVVDRVARRRALGHAARRASLSLALILGLRFAAPSVPGALVLVVGGLLASSLFDLGVARGGAGRRRAARPARARTARRRPLHGPLATIPPPPSRCC